MKIGITYTLKDTKLDTSNLPDDWQEELDNMTTIDGIAGVADQFSEKDLLVGIERMGDDIQDLAKLAFEFQRFLM